MTAFGAGPPRHKRYAQVFAEHDGRLAHKWEHYFAIYERHLARFCGASPQVLEIGVWKGGSAQILQTYFGPGCAITGLDIHPDCAQLSQPGIDIHTGDQGDADFWDRFLLGREFDIIIDDGSHRNADMTVTLRQCWPSLKPGGVYLIEDTMACYQADDQSQADSGENFVEACKRAVDELYAFWSAAGARQPSHFSLFLDSIHFYDAIVVLEKRTEPKTPPLELMSGSGQIPQEWAAYRARYLQWRQSMMARGDDADPAAST